jgi:hypothetical protein
MLWTRLGSTTAIPTACIYAYTTVKSTKLNPRFTLRCPPTKHHEYASKCHLHQDDSPLAALHVEHIIPKSHEETGDLDNLALACIDCNSKQKEQTWRASIRKRVRSRSSFVLRRPGATLLISKALSLPPAKDTRPASLDEWNLMASVRRTIY